MPRHILQVRGAVGSQRVAVRVCNGWIFRSRLLAQLAADGSDGGCHIEGIHFVNPDTQNPIVTIDRIDQYIDISTSIECDQVDYNQLVQ